MNNCPNSIGSAIAIKNIARVNMLSGSLMPMSINLMCIQLNIDPWQQ